MVALRVAGNNSAQTSPSIVGITLQIISSPTIAAGTLFNINALGHLTGFNVEQNVSNLGVHPLDRGGRPINADIYHGWDGTISFVRYNPNATALGIALGATGQRYGQQTYFSVNMTCAEACGIQSLGAPFTDYVYQDCTLSKFDPGKYEEDRLVTTQIKFRSEGLLHDGVALDLIGFQALLTPYYALGG